MKHLKIKSEKGIALLMVISSITILTYVLAEFTFDTNLNKIRTQNKMDQFQARLNAEAGLKFALAKLKIYKEAYNLLEKNKNLKDMIGLDKLEMGIRTPFIYPIPLTGELNIIQKTALAEFDKAMLIRGAIQVNIDSVSGFINPNNLALHKKIKSNKKNNDEESDPYGENSEKTFSQLTQQTLLETLTQAFESEKESNEEFETLYGSIEPEVLVKELTYYVSDPRQLDEADKAIVDSNFVEAGIFPKHAPLTSLSELYQLPSWSDEIINLIKSRISVHEVGVIHLNEINNKQLKVIFPNITEDQVTEFFKYRDGDPLEKIEPHKFKGESDFKSYIVGDLGVVDAQRYDDRINVLKSSGLSLGVASKLFKVTSRGQYGKAIITLTAYVDLPIRPNPPPKKKSKDKDNKKEDGTEEEVVDKKEEEKKPPPTQLMEPRVVEIQLT